MAYQIDKDAKEARNQRIFDMWMACHTQEEIAETVGVPRRTVGDNFGEFGNVANLAKTQQSAAEHATDFTPPIYNIWKQQTKSEGSGHGEGAVLRSSPITLKPVDRVNVIERQGDQVSGAKHPEVLSICRAKIWIDCDNQNYQKRPEWQVRQSHCSRHPALVDHHRHV